MKFFSAVLALATLITAATAQLSNLPTCAQSCAASSIPSNCGIDVACICNSSSWLADVACCIAGKCDESDQEKTLKAAKGICAAGGVTDIPTTVACSTTAASTTTQANSTTTTSGVSALKTTSSMTTSSKSASSSSTAGAVLAQATDMSLMAAAGAVAAVAMFV